MATKSGVDLTNKATVHERLAAIDGAKESIINQLPGAITKLIEREYNHLKASALCNPDALCADAEVRIHADFSGKPKLLVSLGVKVDWPETISEESIALKT